MVLGQLISFSEIFYQPFLVGPFYVVKSLVNTEIRPRWCYGASSGPLPFLLAFRASVSDDYSSFAGVIVRPKALARVKELSALACEASVKKLIATRHERTNNTKRNIESRNETRYWAAELRSAELLRSSTTTRGDYRGFSLCNRCTPKVCLLLMLSWSLLQPVLTPHDNNTSRGEAERAFDYFFQK